MDLIIILLIINVYKLNNCICPVIAINSNPIIQKNITLTSEACKTTNFIELYLVFILLAFSCFILPILYYTFDILIINITIFYYKIKLIGIKHKKKWTFTRKNRISSIKIKKNKNKIDETSTNIQIKNKLNVLKLNK